MSPYTVTLEPSEHMPRPQGLLQRGTRWYSNFRVPNELQKALGKSHIRESLETSDYREACRTIAFERARVTGYFENEKRKLRAAFPPESKAKKTALTVISKREAFQMSIRYLASLEHEFKTWMWEEGRLLEPHEQEEILSGLAMDARDLAGGTEFRGQPLDGTFELQSFLQAEGVECAVSSPAFKTLRPLFFEAHLEYLARHQDALKGEPIQERNPMFKGIHPQSPAIVEIIEEPTINDLLALRERAVREMKLCEKTADASQTLASLLRDYFGGDRKLSSIKSEDIHQLFDLLRRIPPNATKRYKGMTLAQAVEAADKAEDRQRLRPKTLKNHYTQITALFNLAVEEHLMKTNPAKSRILRKSFDENVASSPRQQFTIAELNRLFRSPLHRKGQKDEESRQGRYWVPLLALFHGMRCNEACQIYTEDVKTWEGISYIAIREEREDGSTSEKKLKTKQSRREVPLHPELKRLGFLEFVEGRRRDKTSPRLFPELTPGHKGYFSDAFSKWFVRFVRDVLGEGCKATMHSFRHQFRDATRAARLPAETVARLAGWENGEAPTSRQMNHYGRGPNYLRTLAEDIAKVEYPDLDLSHLYPSESSEPALRPRLREG